MNWIDKLERRYGSLGIPNLINGLLIGQLAAGIIMLFFNRDFGSLLMLSRTYVLHGQIWRLITFLFQPIWLGGVFGVLNLLFYYWLGNALARVWGDFRTTLFLALSVVLTGLLLALARPIAAIVVWKNVGSVKRTDYAVHHDRNTVAIFRLIHKMGRDKNGDTPVGCLINQLPKLAASGRIDTPCRFIQENNPGMMKNGD